MDRRRAADVDGRRHRGRDDAAVSARAAKARVDAGALLLDVRELDEWNVQHAPDAVLMPMGQVRGPSGRAAARPPSRGRVPLRRPFGGGDRLAAGVGVRRRQPRRWDVRLGVSRAPGVTPSRTTASSCTEVEPLNCETSIPALIGGVVMPNARFYVRNHFPTPTLDPATWRLAVTGLVEHPLRLSLRELQNMRSQTVVATLECAGNGRSFFDPPTPGEQWRLGAVSTAEWTGVPLVEVLDRAVPSRRTRRRWCCVAPTPGVVERSPEPVHFERGLSLDDARGSDAAAGLRDERRAAAAPARLPAAGDRSRLVRRDVGQVAGRDRAHRPRRSTASSRSTATSSSGSATGRSSASRCACSGCGP